MQDYKFKILQDICDRAKGNWSNLSFVDKFNLIRLCREYRKQLVEEILPQLDQICSVTEQYGG